METLEITEDRFLAPYAMRNVHAGGRLFDEGPLPYRTDFQRDRDRIIHSKAFRRLGYKTQVFVNSEGDNYRTRLTHSIEVGQVSRSVARALDLNCDFAETLALAHDLGHTPFGHAGQDALHTLLAGQGGFEHNQQSLRIVTELESRYLEFRGLNLTRATLRGMMKKPRIYDCDIQLTPILEERKAGNQALEAELVDLCDRIAYIHHDLEDGLDSKILTVEELFEVPAWKESYESLEKNAGQKFSGARMPVRIRAVIRSLMNLCITDLIETIRGNLKELELRTFEDVLNLPRDKYPVNLSPTMRQILSDFQTLLFARLYRDPKVVQMSHRGRRMIEYLYKEYSIRPEMMPTHFQERIKAQGLPRVISDYISGMTDRFASKEYRYLLGAG